MGRPKGHTMTARKRKFVDNYMKTLNITQSARDAGYSEYYSKRNAMHLLKEPIVQAYIERKTDKMDYSQIASQSEILYGLTRVFRREETEDVVTTDKNGEVTVTKVRNSVSDSNKAANDLLKIIGNTTQSKMEVAKLRKALADAKRAERLADSDEDSNVTINITPWEDKDE